MLFSTQELQALASLFSRIPMSPPEQQWVQLFLQRLVAFCAPKQEKPENGEEDESTKES